MEVLPNKFNIGDVIDKEGELEFELFDYVGFTVHKHINKDQARQIVEHLTAVFELKED
jgi:hypothetical protein